MSNTLSVKVATRKGENGDVYEGIVSIIGLRPTKLARRGDGSTLFPSRSAISGAARNLAKSLGFAGVDMGGNEKAPAAAKKAPAKKAAPKKAAAPATA